MTMHGGKLELKSREGEGTTVIITLPAKNKTKQE
jgi:signal transduction histidine kinase